MKRILFLSLVCLFALNMNAQSYWNNASMSGKRVLPNSKMKQFYSLDLLKLRQELTVAKKLGVDKGVIIYLPTLNGGIEKFSIHSYPVMDEVLANQYQLGSYIGVGIDDPTKSVRFSISPTDFESMIIKNGTFEFINPANEDKSVYGIHPKTYEGSDNVFNCTMNENILSKEQLKKLYNKGKAKTNSLDFRLTSSDRKYRTLRLALSVTGEYTAKFGGTVSGALTAINNTLTRVNGVLEKDLALHLNLINNTSIIFTNSTTDPYSDATQGSEGAWNGELMNTLHNIVGDSNFDIGHLFGASGGGGNAGCIGCVCNNTLSTGGGANDSYKGSGFTSPSDGNPFGDNFDIDYVAHELGHQLGANHTFSHELEGTGVNMEPGSGSTIMGYAGITSANVQLHSDPYFHIASIEQVQSNLIAKTCDVETSVTNNPPVIASLPSYTIPKSTAFVLSAQVSDIENNNLTYTWEQYDDAASTVTQVDGNNYTGALFRSLLPSNSSVRYFPKFSSVLEGNLTVPTDWETVSNVPRTTSFKLTARDNHPNVTQQQTNSAMQTITVGNDGPFKITTLQVYNNIISPINWDMVSTNLAPYNVSNVKIDYSTDNGNTWNVLATSTMNDGTENFNFSTLPTGQNIKIRVSAINNVFYAISNAQVAVAANCDGSAPTGITATSITQTSANISWNFINNATYVLRYRKLGETTWITINTPNNTYSLTGLTLNTQYEYQVAAICSAVLGTYSVINNFSTQGINYCTMSSQDNTYEYISNVTIGSMSNDSLESFYSDYTSDTTKTINLIKGSLGNTISVTKAWQNPADTYDESVSCWIDFNQNGVFETTEKIMGTALDQVTPVSATFSVPANAFVGKTRMRVVMTDAETSDNTCGSFAYGEVEDYTVNIANNLSTSEFNKLQLQIFPNPANDILNITEVSNFASYNIYNTSGQLVSKGKISNNKVNISKLAKGIYFIEVQEKGQFSKLKFIKE